MNPKHNVQRDEIFAACMVLLNQLRVVRGGAIILRDGPSWVIEGKEEVAATIADMICGAVLSIKHPNLMGDMKEFHEKFGLEYDGPPRALPVRLADFRENFMNEELMEYGEHMASVEIAIEEKDHADVTHHLEHMLDALVDLVYVAVGTAYLHGFDFDEAWRRVHEANMKKERARRAGDSKRGSTFDVIKPPGWEPPSHKDLVECHAHRT